MKVYRVFKNGDVIEQIDFEAAVAAVRAHQNLDRKTICFWIQNSWIDTPVAYYSSDAKQLLSIMGWLQPMEEAKHEYFRWRDDVYAREDADAFADEDRERRAKLGITGADFAEWEAERRRGIAMAGF